MPAIAALTAQELRKAHTEEDEKERLRGLFCSNALIADCISRIRFLNVIHQANKESAKGFLEGGMTKDIPENLRKWVESTSFFQTEGDAPNYGVSPVSPTALGLISDRSGRARSYSTGRNAQCFVCRQLQERGHDGSFTNFGERRKTAQTSHQHTPTSVGRLAPVTVPLPPAFPRIQGGTATGTSIGVDKCALKE
ncbi:uncharacterized protein MONOS_9343 [Monocercomonoides exilis]|uniref:uncharacterized protein n=1 Tax=Monocercomonoides exilis TaxID=2049356 RepID=UPI00355A9A4E|nr:hypothetical protein MONOS_9343 [Monocercomonoides exilis]|eukprot:MONOS_9343.1-p1 / transcript=MONOS_9343.1 / gene=MONOS_9343 / organism=Monocercomonoides_exilis_PA203 / gene_product=unspecified product / transcript_product=unspecified product / location=Mono_scaffold00382:31408-31992(-) / protein_length=195 / sequence_SO=supercontig / SO=protein_coding / is_pseudo=false